MILGVIKMKLKGKGGFFHWEEIIVKFSVSTKVELGELFERSFR